MAFDTKTRNRLNQFVGDARALLTEKFTEQCQVEFGMNPETGEVTELERLSHLDDAQRQTAIILRETLSHYYANLPTKQKDQAKDYQSLIQRIVREQAFTILNRLCAIRMAEARDLVIESIGAGVQSKGFQLYQHVCGNSLGETGAAYQQYLLSLFDEFGVDLPVLFDRYSPQGRLFPRETVLTELIGMINDPEINRLWAEDETIGWIYQYFNSKEERKAMRDASQAPRNSRELAVRNQFFTPRYVVEFLTDNTLGRIWYEMRKGETGLKESCQYLVRRPNEIFLAEGEEAPGSEASDSEDQEKDLTQEELLNQPVHIPHRPLKDPREIRMLDPACGSMHFGLYAFDLYLKIYEEFWDLVTADPAVTIESTDLLSLTETYDSRDAFVRDVPRLIIEHNIHGIDIDPRAVQIAGLSLWLRAQRAWKSQDIAVANRPQVTRSNIVCAEPMPGDQDQLAAFCQKLHPAIAQMVTAIFEEMKLAGEAGSLLKIEEEISSLVTRAKKQYQDNPPEQKSQGNLFGLPKNPKQQKLEFDLSGITDQQFFEQAEETIYEALRKYASETSEGGFRRKLFAGDAEKGFAFVELCQKNFDVALMNPPFGEPSNVARSYVGKKFPEGKADILCCFVDRMQSAITGNGIVGVLSNRSVFYGRVLGRWRAKCVFNNRSLTLFSDLGLGVLDDALVEAAAYTIENSRRNSGTFIRILDSLDKEAGLNQTLAQLASATVPENVNCVASDEFEPLPDQRLAYWTSRKWRSIFGMFNSFEEEYGAVKDGITTGDDFRFLRCYWEAPHADIGPKKRWIPIEKGGEYAPYYSYPHLVFDWNDGLSSSSGHKKVVLRNVDYFEQPGLTYTERTTSSLSVRILRKGCGFSTVGQTMFPPVPDDALVALGLWMSQPCQRTVEMCVGAGDTSQSGSAARHYRNGLLARLPMPRLDSSDATNVRELVSRIIEHHRELLAYDEQSPQFSGPLLFFTAHDAGIVETVQSKQEEFDQTCCEIIEFAGEIEQISRKAFSLSESDVIEMERELGKHPATLPRVEVPDELWDAYEGSISDFINQEVSESGGSRNITKKSFYASRRIEVLAAIHNVNPRDIIDERSKRKLLPPNTMQDAVKSLLSYCVGNSFGRWNRKAIGTKPNKTGFFEELEFPHLSDSAQCAAIHDSQGLCQAIREHLCEVFPETEDLESQLTSIIDASKIDEYVTPIVFFDDHLSKYSKSRRSAPIYWPISTESGSYTLWFYYHRLTDQTLYLAVNDFVDPKLKQTNRQLADLRAIQDRSSTQEKELAQLTELESELEQFKADLLEIATFWKPNLNDGVQITAAPLWKFFRLTRWRNRLKKTWSELESGKYDWAHLALSIWPERVVKEKCTTDRSIAIAHDLEEQLWHEVEVTKVSKSGRERTKIEWQPRDLTDAQLDSIVQSVKSGQHHQPATEVTS